MIQILKKLTKKHDEKVITDYLEEREKWLPKYDFQVYYQSQMTYCGFCNTTTRFTSTGKPKYCTNCGKRMCNG